MALRSRSVSHIRQSFGRWRVFRSGNIQNRFPRPADRVRVELAQASIRLELRLQIGEMHVVIAVRQQSIARLENTRLIAAKVIGKNQVQRSAGFRLVLIVPVRVVRTTAAGYLFRRETEMTLVKRLSVPLDRTSPQPYCCISSASSDSVSPAKRELF
jgi:hypothetical protein